MREREREREKEMEHGEGPEGRRDDRSRNVSPPITVFDDFELIDEVEWDTGEQHGYGELAKRPPMEKPDPCGCTFTGRPCCTDESCVLFACQEECWKCHSTCQNNRILKKRWKATEVFDAGLKGRGLRVMENVQKGDFINEYVGLAVRKAYLERLFSRYKNERMLYIMQLDGHTYIDARKRGGIARFINHSCEPNCVLQKWKVKGIIRIGIFANRPIQAGEELTFDYQWALKRGRAATKCHCGSPSCRGTLELLKSIEQEELDKRLRGHWRKPTKETYGAEIVNRSIKIMLSEHQEYFPADVCRYDAQTGQHLVLYRNDYEEVWEDLSKKEWMILDIEAEQFVIAKKQATVGPRNVSSLLGGSLDMRNGEESHHTKLYFLIPTVVKERLLGKGVIERCRHKWQVVVTVSTYTNLDDLQEEHRQHQNSSEMADQFQRAQKLSGDGVVWYVDVNGMKRVEACVFMGKIIAKLEYDLSLAAAPDVPSGQDNAGRVSPGDHPEALMIFREEVVFPRCAAEHVKNRLAVLPERVRNVTITDLHSDSKSKQFRRLKLEGKVQSEVDAAKSILWTQLVAACKEADAPLTSCGVYKDLGFLGGELRNDLFSLLLNQSTVGLSQECNENLRSSSFFSSFEATQRCTVWVQSGSDMGRIDSANRLVSVYNPSAPRKLYFGCAPTEVPKLWEIVESRAKELKRGIRYYHLGSDRVFQQTIMQNSQKLFPFIERLSGADVSIDSMTGDHLRFDGFATSTQPIEVGDWDSEVRLDPAGRAQLAEELVRLQIELYRDNCIRSQSWVFGRDWTVANPTATTTTGPTTKNTTTTTTKVPQSAWASTGHGKPGSGPLFAVGSSAQSQVNSVGPNGNGPSMKPDRKLLASCCFDITEIVSALRFGTSTAAHSVIILYRFVQTGMCGVDASSQSGARFRDVALASIFLATKAQKANKWRKLDSLLDGAYPTFYPGSKFDPKNEEARILIDRVLLTEDEILNAIGYDVFWNGVDSVHHKVSGCAEIDRSTLRKLLDSTFSGPVLAAGPSLWLKYGIEYVFTAVAGFLDVRMGPLFDAMSLIPMKVSQAAELILESIESTGVRKSQRTVVFGNLASMKATLDKIKAVCVQHMALSVSLLSTMAEKSGRNGRMERHQKSETTVRYELVAQEENRRLTYDPMQLSFVKDALLPVLDRVRAESNCAVFVERLERDLVVVTLEGNWRGLGLAEQIILDASHQYEGAQDVARVKSITSNPINDDAAHTNIRAKTQPGLVSVNDISSSNGWEGTVQGAFLGTNNVDSIKKVSGKACVPSKIERTGLRKSGLRWWIAPSLMQSKSGSLSDSTFVCTEGVSDETRRLEELRSLASLTAEFVGDDDAESLYPLLRKFHTSSIRKNEKVSWEALSMQRWPSDKILKREQDRARSANLLGFSAAALQEMQLLHKMHSLIPSAKGHPNFLLPVAIALPVEDKAVSENESRSQDRGVLNNTDDSIYSLFLSSEENEKHAEKEKKRADRASGPHLLFQPTPFVLQRMMSCARKMKRDDGKSPSHLSPRVFAAWFHDLVSALVHSHTNHVVFRALNPEQVLIDHSGIAKVGALYRAAVLPENERAGHLNFLRDARKRRDLQQENNGEDFSGVPYTAPENLLGAMKHSKATDIWNIGALMAHILLGKPLFQGKERSTMLLSMYKVVGTPGKDNYGDAMKFPFYSKPHKKYKPGVGKALRHILKGDLDGHIDKAIDLIEAMLRLDPGKRISATDALKHEYLLQYAEDRNTESFRKEFVADWMKLKANVTGLFRSEETGSADRQKERKRRTYLQMAAMTGDDDDDNDNDGLYNLDEILQPGPKRMKENRVSN